MKLTLASSWACPRERGLGGSQRVRWAGGVSRRGGSSRLSETSPAPREDAHSGCAPGLTR